MITEKLLKKFLIFLYKHHIEEHGNSISSLLDGSVHVMEKIFSNEHPEAVVGISDDTVKDLTFNLSKELEARNLALIDSLVVTLTPEGYKEAKRLLHPVKHFVTTHWKWLIGASLSFIAVITAVLRLTNCA